MIGIDTNILVRYLTRDDEKQSKLADHFLHTVCTRDTPGYVNTAVLAEVIWVLGRFFGAKKDRLVSLIDQLLVTEHLVLADMEAVKDALSIYKASQVEFADCIILALNRKAGCAKTYTFDKAASKFEAFELLR